MRFTKTFPVRSLLLLLRLFMVCLLNTLNTLLLLNLTLFVSLLRTLRLALRSSTSPRHKLKRLYLRMVRFLSVLRVGLCIGEERDFAIQLLEAALSSHAGHLFREGDGTQSRSKMIDQLLSSTRSRDTQDRLRDTKDCLG